MKKRILSILIVMTIMMPVFNVSANVGVVNSADKNAMERYIKLLIDGELSMGEYVPCGEYNEFIISQLKTVDYEEYKDNLALDRLGWDAIWKNIQEALTIKAYTQEQYEFIFRDIIVKLGEIDKNNVEFVQEEVDALLKMLKTYDNFDKLLEDLDCNEAQVKAYMALRNKKEDLFRVLSGVDIEKDSISGEYSLLNDVLSVFSVAFRDYNTASKYLDFVKEIVYKIADQEADNGIANAMRRAYDKVYLEYHDNFTATVIEIGDQIISRIGEEAIKQSQAVLVVKLSGLGLEAVVSKLFTAADIALYIKDLALNSTGVHQEVEAFSKLNLSIGLTYMTQMEFIKTGNELISDGDFSDDDYKQMNLIFDFCKALQGLNYEYVDNLEVDGFWYNMKNIVGLSNDKIGFIADKLDNTYLIERYLEYAEDKCIINYIDGGQCGETLYWEMTEDGELTIFGNGDMYNSEYSEKIVLKQEFPVGKKHWDNSKVTSVQFEGNVTSIANNAFGGEVSENPFDGSVTDTRCINLKNIVLPDSLHTIGSYAFFGCINLEKVEAKNLKNISYAAFSGCTNLEYENLSNTVSNIAQRAFEGCKSEKFTIPEGVTKLTSGMIADRNLVELTIPETVSEIDANFFYGLPNLEVVYALGKNPIEIGIGVNDMTAGYDFTVYGYESASGWIKELNNPFINNNMGLGNYMPQSNFINFVPITSDIKNPEIDVEIKEPIISDSDAEIAKSEYLKSQEYIKALKSGTEEALDEYMYKYGSGDFNSLKMYSDTDEYALDIYTDEMFNLNYKTAYLDESILMNEYKNKNHYVLIMPENANDIDEGYHYQVSGDGTGFLYNSLSAGRYIAYVRTDISNEVGNDLAIFNITVHDAKNDVIDAELQTAIDFLKENGTMEGYSDGSFKPNKSMTRAEFAAIVCRFTNNDIEFTGEENAFNDVFDGFWGYDYIMNAYQKGFLHGYGDGIFGCDDTLTEEQAVTVLCRMLGDSFEDVQFIETNAGIKGGYSTGYIAIADEKGINVGNLLIDDLQKKVPATRAKIATWLYQLYTIKNSL